MLEAALAAHQQGDPEPHKQWIEVLLRDYYDPVRLPAEIKTATCRLSWQLYRGLKIPSKIDQARRVKTDSVSMCGV